MREPTAIRTERRSARDDEVARPLRRGYRNGAERHGRLLLPYRAFAARARACSPDPSALQLADLFLALACCSRCAGAAEALRRTYAPRLIARRIREGAHPIDAEEAVDELLSDLFGPSRRSGSMRLASYAGRAPLGAWLSAVLRHRAVDGARRRGRAPERLPRDGGAASRPTDDPAVRAELREGAARTGRALRLGLERLSGRQRDVVFLCYFEGRSQREVARLLRMGEPRVSRLVAAATARLRTCAEGPLDEGSSVLLRDRLAPLLAGLAKDARRTPVSADSRPADRR